MRYFDSIQYIVLLAFACLVMSRSIAEFGTKRIPDKTTLKTNEAADLNNAELPQTQKSIEKSIAAAKESLAINTQLSANNKILGRDLNNLAVCYYTAGSLSSKINDSHEHLLEALALLKEAQKKFGNDTTKPDRIAFAISLMNESYVQRDLGNNKRSDQLKQTAQSIFAESR